MPTIRESVFWVSTSFLSTLSSKLGQKWEKERPNMNLVANKITHSKETIEAHIQTVHRICTSRKTQSSNDLRRNANYIQEHGNVQIQKQLQIIFWFPNSYQGTEEKCVHCLLLTIS